MKKYAIALAPFAALPLAACGGSAETANTVVTENVIDDSSFNDTDATNFGTGNVTLENDLGAGDATLDNPAAANGDSLTAIDNSQ